MTQRSSFLRDAADVVERRGVEYGHPLKQFALTAKLWSGLLGVPIKPETVADMMILFKMARGHTSPVVNPDTDLDIAGYAACKVMVRDALAQANLDFATSESSAQILRVMPPESNPAF